MLPEELKIEMLYKQHASIPRNRSLANLFFRSGYIESWGRGTIAITQECKAYGLPAPAFNEQFGGFTIEFYNPETKAPQVTPQVTPQVAALVLAIQGEMTRQELKVKIGLSDREYFRREYLKPALELGLIEMTLPDKPNSKNQKYRRTRS